MSGCPVKNPTCHRETEKECPTRNATGERVCWLGNPPVVYGLKARTDGKIDLTLSLTHRSFLKLIAERGGETSYDYALVTPDVAEHMRCLVTMTLLREVPIIGSKTRVILKLTSAGSNIVDQIKKAGA